MDWWVIPTLTVCESVSRCLARSAGARLKAVLYLVAKRTLDVCDQLAGSHHITPKLWLAELFAYGPGPGEHPARTKAHETHSEVNRDTAYGILRLASLACQTYSVLDA